MDGKRRYTPANAQEFRSNFQGWDPHLLPPELQLPEQRLSALLNILQNGGQTLTVLTMPSRTTDWKSPYTINTDMRNQVGFPVVNKKTTVSHLQQTLANVGMAARSTVNDDEWSLTEFGLLCKPALLFGWQKFLELAANTEINLDPMAVLGTVSKGEKDESGSLKTTPPLIRFALLHALSLTEAGINVEALAKKTNLPASAVGTHIISLAENNLVTHKINARTGRTSEYIITPQGLELSEWPPFKGTHQLNIARAQQVRHAVIALSQLESAITIEAVERFINDTYRPGKEPTSYNSANILSQWAKKHGLVEKISNIREDIQITDIGTTVLTTILLPLYRWAEDFSRCPEITEIALALKRNPLAYQPLYPEIAQSYIDHSPSKNRDREGKLSQARGIINTKPGELSAAELGRALGMTPATGAKVTSELVARGDIYLQKSPKGSKFLLFPSSPESSQQVL